MEKQRLDVLMVQQNLTQSREKAKALIMEGKVLVDGKPVQKPGELYLQDVSITIKEQEPFVSRGGKKLEKALLVFQITLEGKVCVDIGASTGGFTDCMLQHGAKKVYAVDVGYGQLAWELRQDPRVVVMERTNARYLTQQSFLEVPDFASVDVSFISLNKILPALYQVGIAEVVTLIKPQFEAGKDQVGKKGVVRNRDVHVSVIENVLQSAYRIGYFIKNLNYSPIKGPNGNIEYIAQFNKNTGVITQDVVDVVNTAFVMLKNDPMNS